MPDDMELACNPSDQQEFDGLTRLADTLERMGEKTEFTESLMREAGFDPDKMKGDDAHSAAEVYAFYMNFHGIVTFRPLMMCETCLRPTATIWSMLCHFQEHRTRNAGQAGAWVRELVERRQRRRLTDEIKAEPKASLWKRLLAKARGETG